MDDISLTELRPDLGLLSSRFKRLVTPIVLLTPVFPIGNLFAYNLLPATCT
jgi:hypothetical protein